MACLQGVRTPWPAGVAPLDIVGTTVVVHSLQAVLAEQHYDLLGREMTPPMGPIVPRGMSSADASPHGNLGKAARKPGCRRVQAVKATQARDGCDGDQTVRRDRTLQQSIRQRLTMLTCEHISINCIWMSKKWHGVVARQARRN